MRHNCKTNPKRQVVSAEKDFILMYEEIMRRFPRLDEVNKIPEIKKKKHSDITRLYSVVYNCRRPTPCKATQNNEEKSLFLYVLLTQRF